MEGLCTWLGIDPSFYRDYSFAPVNRTVEVRSSQLQRAVLAASALMPKGRIKDSIKQLYLAAQAKPVRQERSADDKAVLAELDAEFQPFNEKLAHEFGLNLEAWQ